MAEPGIYLDPPTWTGLDQDALIQRQFLADLSVQQHGSCRTHAAMDADVRAGRREYREGSVAVPFRHINAFMQASNGSSRTIR
jgi:hypothetical protein